MYRPPCHRPRKCPIRLDRTCLEASSRAARFFSESCSVAKLNEEKIKISPCRNTNTQEARKIGRTRITRIAGERQTAKKEDKADCPHLLFLRPPVPVCTRPPSLPPPLFICCGLSLDVFLSRALAPSTAIRERSLHCPQSLMVSSPGTRVKSLEFMHCRFRLTNRTKPQISVQWKLCVSSDVHNANISSSVPLKVAPSSFCPPRKRLNSIFENRLFQEI